MVPIFAAEARLLLRAAMLIFVYTVAVGIVNGTRGLHGIEFFFDRPRLLAHLHGGTIGWITLATLAAGLWLFAPPGPGERERGVVRGLTYLAVGAAAAYVVTFFSTTGAVRPLMGALTLAAITGFVIWLTARAGSVTLSVPHLGILAAVASAVIGALFGVLLGLKIAFNLQSMPVGIGEAHPAMMVVGFLYPVGMSLIEWAVDPESPTRGATLLGRLQIAFPFTGGLVLAASILFGIAALAPLSLLGQIVGLAIMLVRLGPALVRVNPLERSLARHAQVATVYLVVNLGILIYFIANYIEDVAAAPRFLFLTMDHTIFVGVLTNGILVLAAQLSGRGRAAWVDDAVFWGVTVGLTGFVVALVTEQQVIEHIFTPILGVALLLAIAAHVFGIGGELPRETGRRAASGAGAR